MPSSSTDHLHFAEHDSFVCVGTYDRTSSKLGDIPEEYAESVNADEPAADSGKGMAGIAATRKGKSAATAAPPAASGWAELPLTVIGSTVARELCIVLI